LLKPAEKKSARRVKSQSEAESWEGVDAGLFEQLRTFRKQEAGERGVPPYVVFGDATLRDIARIRPSTPKALMTAKGIGAKKRQQYGRAVLTIVKQYCEKHHLDMDIDVETPSQPTKPIENKVSAKDQAFELFAKQRPIREVAATINRAESTTTQYLIDFIQTEGIDNPTPWVETATAKKIKQTVKKLGTKQKSLIFKNLNGQATYPDINITLACLRN
jgi:ATP-dependent DNA helicase RecQ